MPVDYATSYAPIAAADVFHADRIAFGLDGWPISTRLALNEALAHDAVEWKTVEDHFSSTDRIWPATVPPPVGQTLITFDDGSEITLPIDAVLYAYQS